MSAINIQQIQNTKSFFLNPYLNQYPFIDSKIVNDLTATLESKQSIKHGIKIIKLLNLYFYLHNISLNYLSFKNKNQSEIFTDFLKFITSNLVYTNGIKQKQSGRLYLLEMIDKLNRDRVIKINIDPNISFSNEYNFSSLKSKLKIINGITIKKGKDVIVFSHIPYANHFGSNKVLNIYENIETFKLYSALNRSVLSILSLYLNFLVDKDTLLENSTDKLLGEFAFIYFTDLEKIKININQMKPVWNGFVCFTKDAFKLNINDKFLKVKTERIQGHQTNIKTINNQSSKDKLLTSVPLEVSDDKAMFLLKEKSIQDIEIIKAWAESVIIDYKEQQTIGKYPPDEFFIEDPHDLKCKYKMWREKGFKKWVKNHLNTNAIFNKEHLTAAFFLLIINHPSITGSFLSELTRESVCETDQGTFLIGRKRRKGKVYSEQKVLLNESTNDIVNILLKNSSKMGKLINSNSLTLHVTQMSKFKILKFSKLRISSDVYQSLFSFITKEYKLKKEDIEYFVDKITLTKIRATCAINTFFKYESTKKMAEILGHENYNSSILTHYLPEPIIHFYQSRWIRIFQKGIIYEAMKDSENLFKSIGFNNMDTLDEFLKNHTLKNLPTDNIDKKNSIERDFDECYITVSEESLIALLAITTAVEQADNKNEINEKALFWKNFTERLVSEIENNNAYHSFNNVLSIAKVKSKDNLNSYKEVIYA